VTHTISPTTEIIDDIRDGRMVLLVDDEDRENEGDLVFAAQFATAEKINFMAKHGRGLICMPVTEEHARRLNLPPMTALNRSVHGTNFTVSIEAAQGVTTGISAADRAHTIRVAARPDARPEDVVQPGHVFPLVARAGGVLLRAGHTEACCDLARLAGLYPAAVLCEVMKDDGSMARLPDLMAFATQHGLKIGTIADLIHYRSRTESLIERSSEREISTVFGRFRLIAYRDVISQDAHLALVHGRIDPQQETMVRVHEPLSVADLLDAGSTTHSWNLNEALRTVVAAPSGVIVLLHRTETGAQLLERVAAGREESEQAAKMDLRTYGIGAQILRDLGVKRMKLLATPRRMPSMVGFDLEVTGYLHPQEKP
jgi:3,4-dihydroxy 2-butanone 4-phosphate synthase/GTP cyclohydrolase II